MAKSRVVEYTLKLVDDPSNAATATAFANRFKAAEAASRGGVAGSPAAAAGNRGGFNAGYRQAAAAARRREQKEEVREVEANLREQLAAQKKADRERLASEKAANRERVAAAKAAAREVADAQRQSEREARASARAAATSGGAPAGGSRGGFNAGYDRGSQNQARQAAAEERRENEANIRERIAAEKSAAKESATIAKQRANAEKAASRESEQAAKKTIEAQYKLNAAAKQVLSGFVSIGRAAVLFGVSGEENIEKAVRALARFEAGVSAITGIINLIEGASKAWRVYAAATATATAAQVAFNATAGAGAAKAGMAAAAGGGLVRGAIRYIPHAAAATAGFGAGTYLGSRMLGEGDRRNFGRDVGRLTDWAGFTDNAGDERKKVEQRREIIANMAGRRRARYERESEEAGTRSDLAIREGLNSGGVAGGIAAGEREYAAAKAESERLRGMAGGTIEGADAQNIARQQELSAGREVELINKVIELRKQDREMARETGEARLAKAKEETGELRQQLQIEQQKRNAFLEGQKATREAIGAASADKVARAEAAAKMLRETGQVDIAGGDALAEVGITEPGRQARERAGNQRLDTVAPELKALLAEMNKRSEKQLLDITVKFEQALKQEITITGDNEATMKKFEEILKKWDAELVTKLREMLDAQLRDMDAQAGMQGATRGG